MDLFRKREQLAPVEAAPGAVRRTMAVGDRTLLVEWQMQKGASIPLHQHEHEQIGYLVSGSIDMTVGEETRRLGPGDGYVAPSGLAHGALAHEDSRIVDVFSPVREDYR